MTQQLETEIYYPQSDGQPMGETDAHRDILVYLVTALQQYFANRPDVYVTGNLFIYYVRGQPRLSVCPDVCVAFGSAKRRRETYQTWRDGPFPQAVIEVSSPSTRTDDEVRTPRLYEEQGALEYYLSIRTASRRPLTRSQRWASSSGIGAPRSRCPSDR